MSPRAACGLAMLGCQVYDYVPGKVDWLARNQPVDGTDADTPTIGRHLRQEVTTARPDETVSRVRARVARPAHPFALVTTADGTLLGRLRAAALNDGDPTRAVGEAMEAGPSTLRPHEPRRRDQGPARRQGFYLRDRRRPGWRLLGTVHPGDL